METLGIFLLVFEVSFMLISIRRKRVNIWVLISIFSHAKQGECEERETSTRELGRGEYIISVSREKRPMEIVISVG